MQKAKIFTNDRGTEFYVRIIKQGERYGANLYENGNVKAFDAAAEWKSEKPGVIFYDFEYAFKTNGFGPMGQQVSTYYLETIAEGEAGLDLMSYEEKWKIDAETMKGVRQFLRNFVWTEGA